MQATTGLAGLGAWAWFPVGMFPIKRASVASSAFLSNVADEIRIVISH
ncbi:hypothetical protein NMD1_03054 [Novosphingobium sp. MD-1]|nr:hypothetical protein NMD1_03054 [Novosphingobium sp. MD-1]